MNTVGSFQEVKAPIDFKIVTNSKINVAKPVCVAIVKARSF
jgi:hypothetical protein